MDRTDDDLGWYRSQSAFSDPGEFAGWLDDLPADLPSLREAATELVYHYVGNGDITEHGFATERYAEINLRYSEAMLKRLHTLDPAGVAVARDPLRRMVGCCRDFTLLFVTMARHQGYAARSRVGFASYFIPGWYLDHVVAEVWDDEQSRWRLIEPQVSAEHVDPNDGVALDVLDVQRDRFIVGPQAWRACRSGESDPERHVVAPDLDLPFLRSWSYLAHNLVLDLAAIDKHEMVLWDTWGVIDTTEPPSAETATRLDHLAAAMLADDVTIADFRDLAAQPGLAVPNEIRTSDPTSGQQRLITLR